MGESHGVWAALGVAAILAEKDEASLAKVVILDIPVSFPCLCSLLVNCANVQPSSILGLQF